ncbi:MAG: PDZ domain-containing protein, partial [Oscillospiraceae bacterium]|nr:PDZ domain-containing protein [Oscillospiraceae bacterium]
MRSWQKIIWRSLSYILVAALASAITLALWGGRNTKLKELEQVLNQYFIGEVDAQIMEDAAAEAMVDSLGDRWSYYIPADEYEDYRENKNNAYVGVGLTVREREDGAGLDILEVTPGNSAQEAGVLPGDILIRVDDRSVVGMDTDAVKDLIRGEKGTKVDIVVLRSGEEKKFTLERR